MTKMKAYRNSILGSLIIGAITRYMDTQRTLIGRIMGTCQKNHTHIKKVTRNLQINCKQNLTGMKASVYSVKRLCIMHLSKDKINGF